ncbi:hypothetical protein RRG08_050825 [Elysia crispata]|uniref:Uncharacterized protein n=1 Tax=Elysia crispata TaxID=231223 RepID=A0AAE1DXD5_9GAST|nr:hypothetical protein RRG08_050825 [Elysia crispata]
MRLEAPIEVGDTLGDIGSAQSNTTINSPIKGSLDERIEGVINETINPSKLQHRATLLPHHSDAKVF